MARGAYPKSVSRGPLQGRVFRSRREHVEARARLLGYRSYREQLRRPQPVKSRAGLLGLRSREADERTKALRALSELRRDPSIGIREAARRAGTTPNQVYRWAGDALEKRSGRWRATEKDRLARRMKMMTAAVAEPVALVITDSHTASKIADHANIIHAYVTGKIERSEAIRRLQRFRRDYVQVEKLRYAFLTDIDEIERRYRLGLLSFEDLYAQAA
jgi:hypothetical protein